jgi:fatty acid desaturase
MTQFINDSEHYQLLLARYDDGQPELPGPRLFHKMFIFQRKRELRRLKQKAEQRERQWRLPKPVSCRGPSTIRIMCASIAAYVSCIAALGAVFLFLLWYSGILKVLIWLYRSLCFMFNQMVSFSFLPFLTFY